MTIADTPLNELGVFEAARLIEDGEITSEQLVGACLDRIGAREPLVKAWAAVDTELALRQARECDAGPRRGALHGVPIAVKDIIDTVEYPTGMGSPIYNNYRPKADAACVALARRQGAVILGKSVTCEFAGMTSGPTTNPHAPDHTPGGSSSGSAAAVADFMVPMAYGTQTGGSIIRPASFCGIVGYKPTYATINRGGIKFAAESLDTIGFMARSVRDIRILLEAHIGRLDPLPRRRRKLRFGFCRTYLWDEKAEEDTDLALQWAEYTLRGAGAGSVEFELPESFERVTEMRNIIDNVERAHGMAWEATNHRSQISDVLRERIELGEQTSPADYYGAKCFLDAARAQLDRLLGDLDFLLVPAVNGAAPKGLDFTGDPGFQSIWTALHVPAIVLPAAFSSTGLPVGVQLVSKRWTDNELLAIAAWAEAAFDSAKSGDSSSQ